MTHEGPSIDIFMNTLCFPQFVQLGMFYFIIYELPKIIFPREVIYEMTE